jgi:hypothetical protein
LFVGGGFGFSRKSAGPPAPTESVERSCDRASGDQDQIEAAQILSEPSEALDAGGSHGQEIWAAFQNHL